jgi:hypothetical protein
MPRVCKRTRAMGSELGSRHVPYAVKVKDPSFSFRRSESSRTDTLTKR